MIRHVWLHWLAVAGFLVGMAGPAGASVLVPGETDSGVTLARLQVYGAVHGRGAQTVLNLTFTNHGTARNAQATVLFPVPEGAAVQRLRLKIGDTWMEGEVTGRVQGKQVYDNLRRRTIDPALLAQAGEDLYRLRVFPIPAGGTTEVEIVYWHVLPEEDGVLFYELPLDVSGAATAPVRAPVSLALYGTDLGPTKVKAPADWPGAQVKVAGQSITVACPERVMELSGSVRVGLTPKTRPELVLARRVRDEDGSFCLQVRPEPPAGRKPVPRRFVFCLDRSGSMQGEKIAQAREALTGCLQALRATDSFNIVTFSSSVETFTKRMESAAEVRKSALDFVRGIEAQGNTDIRGAILAALALDAEGKEPLDVIVISDGQQTVGASTAEAVLDPVKDAIAARKAPVRLSVVGIGSDVDAGLLRRMAGAYEGEAAFVTADHAVAGQIESVLARLQSLRLERLTIEVEGAGAKLVTPAYFPAAPYGRPVTVAGNYKEAGKLKVKLSWQEGAEKRSWEEVCNLPAARDDYQGVPILVGAAYADALEAEVTRTAQEEPCIHQIIAAGHVYRLVTRYTSLIALENDELYRQQGVARPERDALGIARKVNPVGVETEKRFGPGNGGTPQRPVADNNPARPAPFAERVSRDVFRNTAVIATAPAEVQVQNPVVTHEPVAASDHFETDNHMDKSSARGAQDAVSDMPLGGTGTVGSIGVGGGGMAGVFGYRDGGGRKKAVGRFGGSQATESAVEAALQWLARHQEKDGSWDPAKLGASEKVQGEAASLAVLAFLGAGYTQKSGRFADTIKRATDWILSRQDEDGAFKVDDADGFRAHAILTLALAESYGMERNEAVGKAAQKAVGRALEIQKKYNGWGRKPGAEPDTLTAAWFVAALKSARIAGLKVDSAGFQGAAAYLDGVRGEGDKGFGPQAGVKAPDALATMAGSTAQLLMGYTRGQVISGVRWADEASRRKPDPAYLYFGTLASFQIGGEDWQTWNSAMKKTLLEKQEKGGSLDGSEKDLDGSWTGAPDGRGRLIATALSALCLEVYYRYLPMYAN